MIKLLKFAAVVAVILVSTQAGAQGQTEQSNESTKALPFVESGSGLGVVSQPTGGPATPTCIGPPSPLWPDPDRFTVAGLGIGREYVQVPVERRPSETPYQALRRMTEQPNQIDSVFADRVGVLKKQATQLIQAGLGDSISNRCGRHLNSEDVGWLGYLPHNWPRGPHPVVRLWADTIGNGVPSRALEIHSDPMLNQPRPWDCGLSSVEDLGVMRWVRNVHSDCEGIVDGCLPEDAPHFDPKGGHCGGPPEPPPVDPDPPVDPGPPVVEESAAAICGVHEGVGRCEVRFTSQDGQVDRVEIKKDLRPQRSTGQVVTVTKGVE